MANGDPPIQMPQNGEIGLKTLYSLVDHVPLVQIDVPRRSVQISSSDAVTLGLRIIEAAKTANVEGFLVDWCRASKWADDDVAELVSQFQKWRHDTLTGDSGL